MLLEALLLFIAVVIVGSGGSNDRHPVAAESVIASATEVDRTRRGRSVMGVRNGYTAWTRYGTGPDGSGVDALPIAVQLAPEPVTEDAVKTAIDARIENIILDLDFGAQHCSGVVVARKVLEARVLESRTRICYEAIIRGWVNPQPGFD